MTDVNAPGSVKFDAVLGFVDQGAIPEPGTAGVFGMVVLGFIGRRGRRAA
jgi:hypothetical protein